MAFCVIFGAGKIARGFIGHLLYLSGHDFVFVEQNRELVELINRRGQYTVRVLGKPHLNTLVKGVRALCLDDAEKMAEAVDRASVIFTAVGGKNLKELARHMAGALAVRFSRDRDRYLNIVTCENWKDPAEILRQEIERELGKELAQAFRSLAGITEAVVMRSGIEPEAETLKEDPLAVNVSDYWELPLDRARLKGELPDIKGLKPVDSFQGFLERKFYTYNAANGTVSYLGSLKGYEKLADAAHDPEILDILMGVYHETGAALCARHHFSAEEQEEFARSSLKKLQDYAIADYIERNARDPLRKLGPEDRLVGPARLAEEYGIVPRNLAVSIAAALHYVNPSDPSALELEKMRKTYGIDYVLKKVCQIDPVSQLGTLVKEKVSWLHRKGWLKEEET